MNASHWPGWTTYRCDHNAAVLEDDLSGDVRVVLMEALLKRWGRREQDQAREDKRDPMNHWKSPLCGESMAKRGAKSNGESTV
jgi:hypothetical protein